MDINSIIIKDADFYTPRPLPSPPTSLDPPSSTPTSAPTTMDEIENAANILVFVKLDRTSSEQSNPSNNNQLVFQDELVKPVSAPARLFATACTVLKKKKSTNPLVSKRPASVQRCKNVKGSSKRAHKVPVSDVIGRLIFKSMEEFEEWAFKKVLLTHPKVVIEKKRSAKTTTISCRNRRSEGAGGTDCTCVLKASEADGENGGPVVWKLILESMKHNESCLKRLNSRHPKKIELLATSSQKSPLLAKKLSTNCPKPVQPKTVDLISDNAKSENVMTPLPKYIELDSDEETPAEIRRRKINNPGNALPSRARRYRW